MEMDATRYIKEVVSKTEALMGTKKVMHLIGGIADCITVGEAAGYVASAKEVGSVGVSLYDFATTQAHGGSDGLWAELTKFVQ